MTVGVVCGIAERAARALFRRLTRASNSPQDGEITPEEFQVALEKLDAGRNILSLDEEGISDLVDKFDKDGDGKLSKEEFSAKQQPKKKKGDGSKKKGDAAKKKGDGAKKKGDGAKKKGDAAKKKGDAAKK